MLQIQISMVLNHCFLLGPWLTMTLCTASLIGWTQSTCPNTLTSSRARVMRSWSTCVRSLMAIWRKSAWNWLDIVTKSVKASKLWRIIIGKSVIPLCEVQVWRKTSHRPKMHFSTCRAILFSSQRIIRPAERRRALGERNTLMRSIDTQWNTDKCSVQTCLIKQSSYHGPPNLLSAAGLVGSCMASLFVALYKQFCTSSHLPSRV